MAQPTANSHFCQMIMLAILVPMPSWACLIRSDFNFVFIMFSYFIFVGNRQYLTVNVVFIIVVILVILDLFFFIFVPRTWMSEEQSNTIWNNMKALRGFAIFCSVIILLLKLPLIFFLWRCRAETKNASNVLTSDL